MGGSSLRLLVILSLVLGFFLGQESVIPEEPLAVRTKARS